MDVFDIIDDLEMEETMIYYNYLNQFERKERVVRERPDHLTVWDDSEFQRRFRLQKDTVQYLLSMIEDKIKHQTERNQCVPPIQQLLATLRLYATGSFYITIGDFGGLSSSTLCCITKRVTEAIASLQSNFIKMPNTRENILRIQEGFYKIARFPRVIAAIDCTHIRIQSPGGDSAEDFRNRKGFFSLNVQALCTSNLKFQDVVARWPGSTHDSLIFANSAVKHKFDVNSFGNSVILGDSGYFLNNYLVTPFNNPQTQAQYLYNESHIRSRNAVERCFGVWKRRFPILSVGMRYKLPLIQDIIIATAVLHNLAIDKNEEEPPRDPEVQIPEQILFPPVIAQPVGDMQQITREALVQYFDTLV